MWFKTVFAEFFLRDGSGLAISLSVAAGQEASGVDDDEEDTDVDIDDEDVVGGRLASESIFWSLVETEPLTSPSSNDMFDGVIVVRELGEIKGLLVTRRLSDGRSRNLDTKVSSSKEMLDFLGGWTGIEEGEAEEEEEMVLSLTVEDKEEEVAPMTEVVSADFEFEPCISKICFSYFLRSF